MQQGMTVGLVAICIGSSLVLILGSIALGMFWRVSRTRNWQPVTGQVITSHLVIRSDNEGSAEYPDVVYTYSVMGQQYRSDKIFVGGAIGGTGARKVVERYPVGSAVQVYFDPQHPERSALERRSPIAGFLLVLGGGMGLIACGIGALLILAR
jgi:hypothetical protein